MARRKKRKGKCWSKWQQRYVSCAAQRAGRKAWRTKHGSKRRRSGSKRRRGCKLYAEYRTPTGPRFMCAAYLQKSLVKKLAGQKWPATFTGRTMWPADYRAQVAAQKAQAKAQAAALLAQAAATPTPPTVAAGAGPVVLPGAAAPRFIRVRGAAASPRQYGRRPGRVFTP